ncbi:MAG: hypothetical protein IEMM0002_1167 [bacterium]|nr:MAG: hypothetical protein IEMM0002_1167 [bacterium]
MAEYLERAKTGKKPNSAKRDMVNSKNLLRILGENTGLLDIDRVDKPEEKTGKRQK